MVWVGAEGADSDYEVLEATEPEQHEQRSATAAAGGFASQGMWKPGQGDNILAMYFYTITLSYF